MWMNLHSLPANQHQYVAFVGDRDQDWTNPDATTHDEVDFVAGSHDDSDELVVLAKLAAAPLYDVDGTQEILGIADQSSGEWMYLSEHGKLLKR
jgi:hypothetical protein